MRTPSLIVQIIMVTLHWIGMSARVAFVLVRNRFRNMVRTRSVERITLNVIVRKS